MSIAVVGVNHRTAPLEVRERFAHAPREVPASLQRVLSAGAGGGVLLSTCNRTEFYLAEPSDSTAETVWAILGERLGAGRNASEYGYFQRDRAAVRHLYRVSAGLDSMILGESQIQGQVREAWEASRPQAGPVLHRLFQSALLVGARVRSETALGSGAASAPSAAVGQLENVFLYDIDDLQAVAAHAAAERHQEVPAAERIVSDEVERFWAWYGGLAVVPVLKEFRGRLDDVRAAELERALKRLPHLSPEDRAQVEQFSHALLNKFLHPPTIALKQAAQAGRGYGLLESLKKLFGLERPDGS